MNTTTEVNDPTEQQTALEEVLRIVNDGMLGLQISIGHRTGLFDRMATLPPATSREIAEAAGLQERYVREWLGAMVAGGMVEYDGSGQKYTLPGSRAAFLTRAAGPDNLASLTQFIALMGGVENEIVECFRRGGGVPYSSYPKFHALMAEDSAQIHDALLVDTIIPLAPGLPAALRRGIEVLDIGCGHGHAMNLLAAAFPKSRFTGIDISEDAVAAARAESEAKALGNTRFEVVDAARLIEPERFNLVTAFDAIHDQADPVAALRAVHASLRDGGLFLCVDIAASSDVGENRDHPLGPFLYTVSTMHCTAVSLAQGGPGLGAMWGRTRALEMLSDAGFVDISVEQLEQDVANFYYLARKCRNAGNGPV